MMMVRVREVMRSDGERSCGIVESFDGEHADSSGDELDRGLVIMCGSAGWPLGVQFEYERREQLLGHETPWYTFLTFRGLSIRLADMKVEIRSNS
jgi:hypothetical protein